jgi:hypothetical protein
LLSAAHRDSLVTFCSDVRAELISNAADAAAAGGTQTQQQQQPGGGSSQPDSNGPDTGGGADRRRQQQQRGSNGSSQQGPPGGEDEDEAMFSDVESLADTLNGGSGEGEEAQLADVDVVEGSEEEEGDV